MSYVINNNNLTYEFTHLPVYDTDTWREIEYVTDELVPDGYLCRRDGEWNFVNTPSKIIFSKSDASTGGELPGALRGQAALLHLAAELY